MVLIGRVTHSPSSWSPLMSICWSYILATPDSIDPRWYVEAVLTYCYTTEYRQAFLDFVRIHYNHLSAFTHACSKFTYNQLNEHAPYKRGVVRPEMPFAKIFELAKMAVFPTLQYKHLYLRTITLLYTLWVCTRNNKNRRGTPYRTYLHACWNLCETIHDGKRISKKASSLHFSSDFPLYWRERRLRQSVWGCLQASAPRRGASTRQPWAVVRHVGCGWAHETGPFPGRGWWAGGNK